MGLANSGVAALVGSESLLGREIRDVVAQSAAGIELRLIAADEEKPGRLTSVGDEAVAVVGLDADNIEGAGVVLLAGSTASSHKALELAAEGGAAVIDLTFAADDRAEVRVRSPLVEAQSGEFSGDREGRIQVIAHPAATALALLLRRLHANDPIRRAIVQVLAPASEQGTAGIEELQQQTISLLSFKPLPRAVFDSQLSFNLLARLGAEAPASLEECELRIERHLASLLDLPGEGEGVPMPSLRLVQAPVFHGYAFSVWVEFENAPSIEELENGLAAGHIEVRSGEFEPPTNVGQAGQSGIAVGAIAPDRNAGDACWFWMAADNFRLAAEDAIAVAREWI